MSSQFLGPVRPCRTTREAADESVQHSTNFSGTVDPMLRTHKVSGLGARKPMLELVCRSASDVEKPRLVGITETPHRLSNVGPDGIGGSYRLYTARPGVDRVPADDRPVDLIGQLRPPPCDTRPPPPPPPRYTNNSSNRPATSALRQTAAILSPGGPRRTGNWELGTGNFELQRPLHHHQRHKRRGRQPRAVPRHSLHA